MKTTTISAFAVFALLLATPAISQESSRADFDGYLEAFRGRWVCRVPLTEDMPGFAKRGDKITQYAQCKIIDDGKSMIVPGQWGAYSSTWVIGYDAHAKRIKTFFTMSNGTFSESILFKNKDGVWFEKGTGSTGDGKGRVYEFTCVISDNGKTHTWTGSETIDGKTEKLGPDVWTRLSDK